MDRFATSFLFAETVAGRDAWIARLRKAGWNYFVPFMDTKRGPALIFSTAAWIGEGRIYVCPN